MRLYASPSEKNRLRGLQAVSYDVVCEALKAQGVIVSESRVRKLVAHVAARLPNPHGISPQMLVAL